MSAGSISVQWDPNNEPDVVGYRIFIGTQTGVYSSSVDVGNATSYIFNNALDAQKYCFAVAAYTAGPLLGEKSSEVCSDTSSNQPPTLTNPGNQSNAVGTAATLTLNGSDPEGSPVTFSATGLPTGLTINTNTGFISGTPTAPGTFSTKATVSDGSLSMTQAFTWTITAAAPGVATPLRPSGAIATQTPTFEWESVATATTYRLWVDDASNVDPRIQLDLTPTQAGCATAGAVCHISPGVTLQPGRASWSVRASSASGDGPWSGAIDFTVPDSKAPTVTIVTPTTASTFTASATTLAIGGTAADDAGVTLVTWTNNLGGSGNATGTTSWTANIPLKVGANIVTVTARDAAGNIATDILTVTKADAEGPALSIQSPTSGASYSTTGATVVMSGTASDDGDVTQVSWVNDRGGSGIAAGTTTWSAGAIALKPGANVIAVTANDAAGHKTTKSITVSLTDSDVPVVTIAAPVSTATFSTTSTTLALGGTASDNTGISQVSWSNSKGGNGVASGTTSWTVAAIALQPGDNVITVTAKDATGNVATDVLTVTLKDAVAPEVTITAPTSLGNYASQTAGVTLAGTASDLFGVSEVRWSSDRGGAGVASGTTSWSASITLQPGINVVTVTASDAAGNTSKDRISITSDGKAPVVTIATPAAGLVTKDESVTVSGTASDDVGVTEVTWVNGRGGSGRATGTTAWSVATVALESGNNVITVEAHDAAGNHTSSTVSVLRDSQEPWIKLVEPVATGALVTNKAAIELNGKAGDNRSVVQVTWKNSRGGSGVAVGTAEWSVPSVALLAGVNVITLTARDVAGNLGTVTVTVTLDTRAPALSIATPTTAGSYATNDNAIALGGVASDDVGLAEVTWSNSQGGSGRADGTTAWTARGIDLKPGLNTLTVTARDAAGNSTSATLAVRVTDIRAPRVRIVGPSAESSFSIATAVINLEGVASDDFGIVRVTWTNDRGVTGVAKGDDHWIAGGLTLHAGVNVFTVTATDPSGNVSTDVARITYDQGLPSISLTSPTTASSYTTSSSHVALTGVASDDSGIARVTWSTDKGQVGVAVGTTAWSIADVTVLAGTTAVTVTAHDNSGNSSSLTLSVVNADTIKPTVKVYTPTTASSLTTTAPGVTLAGTATDDMGVTAVSWATDHGASGTAFGTTSWSTPTISLAPGTTVVTITARDAAGNKGTTTLTVTSSATSTSTTNTATSALNAESTSTVSTGGAQPAKADAPAAPPVIRIVAPAGSGHFKTTASSLTVAGVADHASGIAVVRWTTNRGDSGVAVGTTKWSIPAVALQAGMTTLTVTAVAAGGDVTNAVLLVTRQDALPKLSILSPTADSRWSSTTGTVGFKGTATDNVVRVSWSSDSGGNGVADGTAAWTIRGIRLQAGANRITLTAQDDKGRTDRQVVTVDYQPRSGSTSTAAKKQGSGAVGAE